MVITGERRINDVHVLYILFIPCTTVYMQTCVHYILQFDTCRSAGTKQELPVTPYTMEVRVEEKLGEEKYTSDKTIGRSDHGVSESADVIVAETVLSVCAVVNDQEVSVLLYLLVH